MRQLALMMMKDKQKIGIKEAQFQVMNWKVGSTNPGDDDDQDEKWILGGEYRDQANLK